MDEKTKADKPDNWQNQGIDRKGDGLGTYLKKASFGSCKSQGSP